MSTDNGQNGPDTRLPTPLAMARAYILEAAIREAIRILRTWGALSAPAALKVLEAVMRDEVP